MMKTTWDMKIRFFTIPNLLTLSNLLCGTFAALSALVYDNLEWAFWFVVLAAVFDFFDGFAARLLHQSSPIGVQLDSLADMISFGFVPAAVVYTMTTRSMGEGDTLLRYAFAFICFAMAAFSALRLAKFNIDETQHEEFCGLPTPANALFFTSLGLISAHTGFDFGGPVLICIVPAMAWLLISPVRMFSLKFQGFGWRGKRHPLPLPGPLRGDDRRAAALLHPGHRHPLHPHFGDPLGPAPEFKRLKERSICIIKKF